MISIIIPAFNEEETIGGVVSEVIDHPDADEVIVVSDGSTDKTSENARTAGAKVIELPENRGKAEAMDVGVREARNRVVLFMDADLKGFTHEKISRIIDPVLTGDYEMFVAVRARSVMFLNRNLHFFPIIGGVRALTKPLWYSVPADCKTRFKIEVALNYTSKQTPGGMSFTLVEGIDHYIKEKKYGFIKGMSARLSMIWDVTSVSVQLYVVRPIVKRVVAVKKKMAWRV